MTNGDTQSNAKSIDPSSKYNPVHNRRNERVRGLWERNGVFYAQVNVRGWIGRVPLHDAQTVADAQAARQVLKAKIRSGIWKTPKETAEERRTEEAQKNSSGATLHVLKTAIEHYQNSRDLLGKKDKKTCKREDSGLKLWTAFKPELPISPENFDAKLLLDFAEKRKATAKAKERLLSGRAIDVNITALANVLRWCVDQKWLLEFPPKWQWNAMAEQPEECELLTDEQVDQLCAAALTVPEMGLLDPKRPRPRLNEFLAKLTDALRGFADFLRLLSLCGARETETLLQRWSNVWWSQRKFHFPGGRRGGTKRGGGSRRAAKPRDVDFFDKLEAHLKDMFERRDPQSDWMFPNEDGNSHIKSYRKQLERVRSACNLPFVGFHHFRHYLISWCAMKGLDIKTIAHWVVILPEVFFKVA